jgi:hypothetical protein
MNHQKEIAAIKKALRMANNDTEAREITHALSQDALLRTDLQNNEKIILLGMILGVSSVMSFGIFQGDDETT